MGQFVYFRDMDNLFRETWYFEKKGDETYHGVRIRLSREDKNAGLNSRDKARECVFMKYTWYEMLISNTEGKAEKSLITRGKLHVFTYKQLLKLKQKAMQNNVAVTIIQQNINKTKYFED